MSGTQKKIIDSVPQSVVTQRDVTQINETFVRKLMLAGQNSYGVPHT